MKNLVIGLICSFLPIYRFVTWIIVFNDSSLQNHIEKVKAYHKDYFFNMQVNEQYASIISILLLMIAVYSILKTQVHGIKAILKIPFLLGLIFIAAYNLYGLL